MTLSSHLRKVLSKKAPRQSMVSRAILLAVDHSDQNKTTELGKTMEGIYARRDELLSSTEEIEVFFQQMIQMSLWSVNIAFLRCCTV